MLAPQRRSVAIITGSGLTLSSEMPKRFEVGVPIVNTRNAQRSIVLAHGGAITGRPVRVPACRPKRLGVDDVISYRRAASRESEALLESVCSTRLNGALRIWLQKPLVGFVGRGRHGVFHRDPAALMSPARSTIASLLL